VLDAGDRCRNLVTAIVKASDVIFAAD